MSKEYKVLDQESQKELLNSLQEKFCFCRDSEDLLTERECHL